MRVIKFRGKQPTWIYGGISIFNGEATIFDCECPANSAYQVDLNTVGQFTGLTDKNGKEIYEGDILQTETGIASVIWSDAAFALLSPGSEATDWEHSSVYDKSEVIGNIHENSDLL